MVILFFFELFLLFLLSRALTSELSLLFYKIFRGQKASIFLMAILFLPGTIIHELSHAVMAKVLFVYVGKMSLMPSVNGQSLKLGSVEVGRADILRNLLIGIAPFLVGTSLLLGVLYFGFSNNLIGYNLFTFLILLFTFIISNTMYSSRKDMEGAVSFFVVVFFLVALFYFLGVRIPNITFETLLNNNFNSYFEMASLLLAIPIVVDVAIILFAKIITSR